MLIIPTIFEVPVDDRLVNVALDELRIVRAHPFYMEGFLIVFHSIDERGLHPVPNSFHPFIASHSPFIFPPLLRVFCADLQSTWAKLAQPDGSRFGAQERRDGQQGLGIR